jgi:hypothetical protein
VSPRGSELLRQLGSYIPGNGLIRVTGGTENELLRPLDIAPYPNRPARALYTADVISADLERLASLQQEDGGWIVDYVTISPAGSLDSRYRPDDRRPAPQRETDVAGSPRDTGCT